MSHKPACTTVSYLFINKYLGQCKKELGTKKKLIYIIYITSTLTATTTQRFQTNILAYRNEKNQICKKRQRCTERNKN